MQGASAEELDEFLVRYNRNGIELNEEGFQKLSEEISLESIETKLDLPWGKETRHAFLRRSSNGRNGRVACASQRDVPANSCRTENSAALPTHCYYEVCTAPALFDLVAALIRTNQAAAIVSSRA